MEIYETVKATKRSKYNRSAEDQRRLRLAYDLRLMLDNSESEESERMKLALRKAIEMLTPKQKDYLMLYFYQGMTIPTIANLRGVDRSTVSRTLYRARRNLYGHLRFTCSRFLVDDSFMERIR